MPCLLNLFMVGLCSGQHFSWYWTIKTMSHLMRSLFFLVNCWKNISTTFSFYYFIQRSNIVPFMLLTMFSIMIIVLFRNIPVAPYIWVYFINSRRIFHYFLLPWIDLMAFLINFSWIFIIRLIIRRCWPFQERLFLCSFETFFGR